jgi:phage terminase large subunit
MFDARAVNRRLASLTEEGVRGRFLYETMTDPEREERVIRAESIVFQEDETGEIVIYCPPEEDGAYVIGADTAGEGSDFFAAQVLDNRTGVQVAVLHSEYDEDVFAKQMYCLGVYYGQALIGIEANFSTYPIRELERLGYDRQYVREAEDRFTHRMTESFGVKTTAVTRPVMLAALVQVVREQTDTLMDRATLGELLTFVRNEKGRAEAQYGAHDDLVMALAIAHYIRPQQVRSVERPQVRKKSLPPELVADEEKWENGVMVW